MRRLISKTLTGTALCALLITSGAVSANLPKMLTAFSGNGGTLGDTTARGPDNVPYDCYAVEVPAGTEFTVSLSSSEFTPEIWVARGAHCTSSALQAQSDRSKTSEGTAQLSFKSAGGRYLILARADDATGLGRYRIRLTTSGGSGLPGGGVTPVFSADAGESASAPGSLDASGMSGPLKDEDARVALMRKQVKQRNDELAAEAARKAEAEKQRQLALAKQRELERQQAAARQSSGGGNGGLFGGLAMGLGAVLAGGNTETVMGAAMKGVELTTDDPNVRAAIAGQGDAMMANGLGVSKSEVVSAMNGGFLGNAGGAALGGGGGGAWRTEPAFGSSSACSMMNETNYKQVALSGGPDTQLLTLCGAAWNYYWMYHNAKNQGYSASDAEVTYQAHADAAKVAIEFYNSSR